MGQSETYPNIINTEVRAVGVAIHDSLEKKRLIEAKKKETLPAKSQTRTTNRAYEETVMLQKLIVNG